MRQTRQRLVKDWCETMACQNYFGVYDTFRWEKICTVPSLRQSTKWCFTLPPSLSVCEGDRAGVWVCVSIVFLMALTFEINISESILVSPSFFPSATIALPHYSNICAEDFPNIIVTFIIIILVLYFPEVLFLSVVGRTGSQGYWRKFNRYWNCQWQEPISQVSDLSSFLWAFQLGICSNVACI